MSEETTLACPACDSSRLALRNPSRPSSTCYGEPRYRCMNCEATFEEAVRREKYTSTGEGRKQSPHIRALLETDPDAIGGGVDRGT